MSYKLFCEVPVHPELCEFGQLLKCQRVTQMDGREDATAHESSTGASPGLWNLVQSPEPCCQGCI